MSDYQLNEQVAAAAAAGDKPTLWSVTEAYLAKRGRAGQDVSKHTLRAYEQGLSAWLEYIVESGVDLLAPGRDAGTDFVDWLRSGDPDPDKPGAWLRPPLAFASVAVRVTATRRLYGALRWAGVTQVMPFDDVATRRDPTPRHEKARFYTTTEIRRLVDQAATADERLTILLGSDAGLRASEIVGLPWSALDVDIAADRRRLRVTGKGGVTRTVDFSPRLASALVDQQADAPDPIYILGIRTPSALRHRLRRLCERSGVPYKGPHALRHYFGSRLYEKSGNDIKRVAAALGHSRIDTSEIYVHLSDKQNAAIMQDWD